MRALVRAALLLLICSAAQAKIYFKETFDGSWQDRWSKSTWKVSDGTAGEWEHTAGKWYGDDEADKGIKTAQDARFYALYAELEEAFDNEGKDFVLQFSVKHEQKIDCGGGYLKVMPESSADGMKDFGGDTPYSIMFGPDICGYQTKKVHVILPHKGKNFLIKKDIKCETDQLTHIYTLLIKPDNTYKVFIDLEEVADGSLFEDWSMLPPAKIKDPEAKKPDDWDDRKEIADPEEQKPEGWDDIPEFIPDPDAVKPEDWDTDEDGEWESPNIRNPDYKGEWKPKMVDNPDYKGVWEPPEVDNPEYEHDESLYHMAPTKFVGFELWQVKSGSIFDNVLIGDDLDEAKKFAEDTWGKSKDAEKKMFDELDSERRKKEEEEMKKMEEERMAMGEDEDDEYGEIEEDDYAFDEEDAVKDEL